MPGSAFDGNAARLAELLAMRLCHDFSGLIGTLGGALELLDEISPKIEATASEALVLAGEAARSLNSRLRLLRAAWGAASSALSVATFEGLAGGVASPRHRLRLDFVPTTIGFSAAAGQLALNVLLLAGESLPRGGVIAMSGDPAGLLRVGIEGLQATPPRCAACNRC
jgi:histidine phosphotransferase ChpT